MKRKRSPGRPRKRAAETLLERNVSADPIDQFNSWFQRVLRANLPQPYAMTLATASPDGNPTARIVLLKKFDQQGFTFYTNYDSTKGRQLSENDRAALLMYWPAFERQVRIEGRVEKLTREESAEYFSSRPRKSRIGAWASRQSEEIGSRTVLEAQFKKYLVQFRGTDIPLPDFWGGFRLIPRRIEFWQGRENRLHDRIVYKRENALWKIVRLSP